MNRLRCALCGEIIGVYELIWVRLADGSECAGSLLSLDVEPHAPNSVAIHERCHRSDTASQTPQPGGDV
jgi:hypothetical protein